MPEGEQRSALGSTLLCQHHAELRATDTHCHLERFHRPPDVLDRARAAGVRVIAVTSRPSDFRMLFPLYGRRAGLRLALGLHPLEVERIDLRQELALFRGYAAHTSYIGEIGLDLSPEGRPSRRLQEEALASVLSTPDVPDKVLTVHSRRAARQTIEHLTAAHAGRVIMHWFSGSVTDLEVALNAGFYFSINPAMIRSKKGQAVAAAVPRNRVLLESDGPYVRVRGRDAEPADVISVADYLGRQWEESGDDVLARLAANLRQLCEGLPDLNG
jgi:TatD DNase family protein